VCCLGVPTFDCLQLVHTTRFGLGEGAGRCSCSLLDPSSAITTTPVDVCTVIVLRCGFAPLQYLVVQRRKAGGNVDEDTGYCRKRPDYRANAADQTREGPLHSRVMLEGGQLSP
jgi:hypothetical protein